MHRKLLSGNVKGRDNWEDLGLDEITILKCILNSFEQMHLILVTQNRAQWMDSVKAR